MFSMNKINVYNKLNWCLIKYYKFSTSQIQFNRNRSGSSIINYYNHLEISKNATQTEIKSAYYKLSMLYHPDKNKGLEAAEKFRQIATAYEILGNVRTRKLYDRGLANVEYIYESPAATKTAADFHKEEDNEDEKISKFHKSRMQREPSKIYTGRTETYNFDEWTRAHYSNSFKKILYSKTTSKYRRDGEKLNKETVNESGWSIIPVVIVIFFYLFYEVFNINSYDNPSLNNKSTIDTVGTLSSTETVETLSSTTTINDKINIVNLNNTNVNSDQKKSK